MASDFHFFCRTKFWCWTNYGTIEQNYSAIFVLHSKLLKLPPHIDVFVLLAMKLQLFYFIYTMHSGAWKFDDKRPTHMQSEFQIVEFQMQSGNTTREYNLFSVGWSPLSSLHRRMTCTVALILMFSRVWRLLFILFVLVNTHRLCRRNDCIRRYWGKLSRIVHRALERFQCLRRKSRSCASIRRRRRPFGIQRRPAPSQQQQPTTVKRLKSISFWGWVIDLKRWKIRIKAFQQQVSYRVVLCVQFVYRYLYTEYWWIQLTVEEEAMLRMMTPLVYIPFIYWWPQQQSDTERLLSLWGAGSWCRSDAN